MIFKWRHWLVVLTLVALAPASALRAASPQAVDLALVLAVDASMSVDESEATTQRAGYIHALRDKRVGQAIRGGPIGRVAITYVEWSSPYHQSIIIPWRVLASEKDAQALADELEKTKYTPGSTTSISGGIDFSVKLFRSSEFEAQRRVIDVSGDGYSDFGRNVVESRDDAVKAGITINGLAIMTPRPSWRQPTPPDLDTYYRDNVIGGPGSFYLSIKTIEDFSRAVLQKLVLEISSLEPEAGAAFAQKKL